MDLENHDAAIEMIAKSAQMSKFVVEKSTIPYGTANRVVKLASFPEIEHAGFLGVF